MKNAEFKGLFFLTSVAIIIMAAPQFNVSAQGSRTISSVSRRIEQINRQSEQYERDRMNRELKGHGDSAENLKRAQALRDEIKRDLEAIQSTYNRIVSSMQSGGDLSRNFIIENVGNIKKHTERLAVNLALPEANKDENKEMPAIDFSNARKSLVALCRHIFNFITNSIFDTPKILDLEQAAKARRELDLIIQLSGKIKENSESYNQ